jgi:hypothetical protein
MRHLKDLPAGTIWPHLLDSIERDVPADIRDYAASRKADVVRDAEPPSLRRSCWTNTPRAWRRRSTSPGWTRR